MTLSITRTVKTHDGNNSATVFPYDFFIPTEDDVQVYLYDLTALTLTLLSPATYDISGIGDEDFGNVTYPLSGSPLTTNDRLIIARVVPYTQDLDIGLAFVPEALEEQLDRMEMQIQQLATDYTRVPKTMLGAEFTQELPHPEGLANKYLAFDSNGQPYAVTIVTAGTITKASTGEAQAGVEDTKYVTSAGARAGDQAFLDLGLHSEKTAANVSLSFEPVFSGDWFCQHYLRLTRTDATFGTGSAFTMAVMNDDVGLDLPVSGPYSSYNTGALFLEAKRTDFLTSTEDGQVIGLYVNTFSPRNSRDGSALLLGGGYKTVPDSTATGELLLFEFRTFVHSASAHSDLKASVGLIGGWWASNSAANYMWELKQAGYVAGVHSTVSWGAYSAYVASDNLDVVASDGWEWYFSGHTSKSNAPVFSVAGSANATYNPGVVVSDGGANADSRFVAISQNGAAAAGPIFEAYRLSGTPAANDSIGGFYSYGRNSTPAKFLYAAIGSFITDPTAASEDGGWSFLTASAGTLATRLTMGAGLYHPSATGTDKGNNTINFGAVYDDNVLLTCAGVEYILDGTVTLKKWDGLSPKGYHRGAHFLRGMLDEGFNPRSADSYFARMLQDRGLPGMPVERDWVHNDLNVGDFIQHLWLSQEMLAGAVFDINSRLTRLEATVRGIR